LVQTNERHVQVFGGGDFTCALESASDIASCWGANDRGQFAFFNPMSSAVPVSPNPSLLVDGGMELGRAHGCALVFGRLQCWGDDAYGQLGRGAVGGSSAEARAVPGLWQALAVGGDHTCALAGRPGAGAAGEVWCWGRNDRGQLGTSDRMPRSAPTLVVEP
jgi:alpha-tubulin suppressor-like RCC1 family protein